MGKRGRPRKELPPDLVERYASGELSVSGVAALAGCSTATAASRLAEAGVLRSQPDAARLQMRRRNAVVTCRNAERNVRIHQLRSYGLTLAAIGDLCGLTRERVRQILIGV